MRWRLGGFGVTPPRGLVLGRLHHTLFGEPLRVSDRLCARPICFRSAFTSIATWEIPAGMSARVLRRGVWGVGCWYAMGLDVSSLGALCCGARVRVRRIAGRVAA